MAIGRMAPLQTRTIHQRDMPPPPPPPHTARPHAPHPSSTGHVIRPKDVGALPLPSGHGALGTPPHATAHARHRPRLSAGCAGGSCIGAHSP